MSKKSDVIQSKKFLLKDQLFNREKVEKLAEEIADAYPDFKKRVFVREVMDGFPERELKARISWMTLCLRRYLPSNYKEAVKVMLKALPPSCDPSLSDNDFGDFIYAPYADFVAQYGCKKENLTFSLSALKKITTRFSAEDAIRYFINKFPKETLEEIKRWSKDTHYHVRRLASEGTRPKLPWAQKIHISINKPISILNNLFYDSTRFVTRSVANHLNDISKIDPDLVISTLTSWKKSGKQRPEEMEWMIRHSLRTLVKLGNKKALAMLGINHEPKVRVSKFITPDKVQMNSALEFSFDLKASEDTTLVIDYVLYFQNKDGKLNSKKIFKLKKFFLKEGDSATLSKRHPLRQFMTTRTLYLGRHEVALQINGTIMIRRSFVLIKDTDTLR